MEKLRVFAFADEASPAISGQIAAMERNGLQGLEIRGVDGENVSGISLDKAREVRRRLEDAGLTVWSVGSPIGKIDLEKDDFAAHLDKLRHTLDVGRELGAKQTDIFFKITIPASTPFILVAARLGLSTSLTTLMASEIVGGDKGIGMMIQQANGYYQMDVMLMGIILLGIIGIIFEKIVKFLERRFTGWQETIQA